MYYIKYLNVKLNMVQIADMNRTMVTIVIKRPVITMNFFFF